MNSTVWKFTLAMESRQVLWMPGGAEVLTVQMQGVDPVLWATVDPHAKPEDRLFVIVDTGNAGEVPEDGEYVATFQHPSGFVGHVFEVPA